MNISKEKKITAGIYIKGEKIIDINKKNKCYRGEKKGHGEKERHRVNYFKGGRGKKVHVVGKEGVHGRVLWVTC